MTDEILIRQVKKGNRQAMGQLMEKHYDEVYRYCFYHLGERELAQDLTQDTFCRVLQHLESYQHYGKFLNYLYVIAGNLCKDYFKKQKPVYMDVLPETSDTRPMEQVDEQLMIRRELEELPIELREVVILRFYHDLKIKDIARIQEVSASLIQHRLKKAIGILREQINSREVQNEKACQK